MMRKRLALLFLLLAQVVVLGHGMVAHHHHIGDLSEHRHRTYQAKHDHDNSNPLSDGYSGFAHSEEEMSFVHGQSVQTNSTVENQEFIADLICIPSFLLISTEDRVDSTHFKKRSDLYSPPLHDSWNLRGPPAFIVA